MKSILKPFFENMYLDSLERKEQKEVMAVILRYLLGTVRYKVTVDSLKTYDNRDREFRATLRGLNSPMQEIYRIFLRKYVLRRSNKLSVYDKKWLSFYRLDNIRKKITIDNYPTEREAMVSMGYTVNSHSWRLRNNRKLLRMTQYGVEDIRQAMFLRIIGTYRLYLPCLGRLLPLKAFYKTMHQALSSSLKDSLREFDTKKLQMTIPYSLLGEDFEDSVDLSYFTTGKYGHSPELIFQARELVYKKLPVTEARFYDNAITVI